MNLRLKIVLPLLAFGILSSACTGDSASVASSWPGLSADSETVYLAFGPHVYALQTANGRQVWKYPAEPERNVAFYSAPVLSPDGSQLITGGYNNVLYSLNPDSGQPNGWAFQEAASRYIGTPLITADGIFAPSADGRLYALDASGSPLWPEPFEAGAPQWSQPASSGETIFTGSLDHNLYALNTATGQLRWSVDLGGAVVGTPLLVDGVVYAGSFARQLFALDAETGDELWRFTANDWIWGGPAGEGNLILVADIQGHLFALDRESGEEIWRFEAEGGIYGSPLIANGLIFIGTDLGKVYAIDMQGRTEWVETLTTGQIYSQPVLAGELVLFALVGGDNLVVAYDLDGSQAWSFNPAAQD